MTREDRLMKYAADLFNVKSKRSMMKRFRRANKFRKDQEKRRLTDEKLVRQITHLLRQDRPASNIE